MMKVIPAPLAGWTDYAFRRVLVRCGAREVWTEMISATALARGNTKTRSMVRPVPRRQHGWWGRRVWQVVQLFGNQPADFAAAILSGVLRDYQEINLNFGCPAPKIVKNHCGCYLMTDWPAAAAIIQACRAATRQTKQKLSVKMRLGWEENNAVAFAQQCVAAGVDRLIVHGRLGRDGYRGRADYAAIAAVKAAVPVPVIANGDVRDRASAQRCWQITKADGIMLGRALCGAPWRIKLRDRVPGARYRRRLWAQQQKWHQGNPSDLIKHRFAYQKFDREQPRPIPETGAIAGS